MASKREELQQIAEETVQRSGFNNLSFRTLADKAQVKSSSVHYYFPAKSDLASAIIANYMANFSQALSAIDAQKRDPKRKLLAFVDIFEKVLKDDRFCLCGMLAAEVSTLDKDNRRALVKFFDETESWIRRILEQNKDRLTCKLDPDVLARIVLSGLEGALLIDRVADRNQRLKSQREFIRSLFE